MSEEAAFLAALKANPTDDTARLVYADWLDEHDEPQKAEYLRLVADVARADGDPEIHPRAGTLLALSELIPLEWQKVCGGRFAIVLNGFARERKAAAIMRLRKVSGLGFGEAKRESESLPNRVYHCIPFQRAIAVCRELREVPTLDVQLLPTPQGESRFSVTIQLVILREYWGTDSRLEEANRESALAMARFLTQAFATPEAEAVELSRHGTVNLQICVPVDERVSCITDYLAMLPQRSWEHHWVIKINGRIK